jgi:hypothetical protein
MLKSLVLIFFILSPFSFIYSHSFEECDMLRTEFYYKTNYPKTADFKDDVLKWIVSNDFKNFINKQDSTFQIIIPIKNKEPYTFKSYSNSNILKQILNYNDKDYYNIGYANYIAFQLLNLKEQNEWIRCKEKKERGLNVFIFDTLFETCKLNVSYLPFDSITQIHIRPIYFQNLSINTSALNSNSIINPHLPSGGDEYFVRRIDLRKPAILIINSSDYKYGKFIFMSASEPENNIDTLSFEKYYNYSNWIKNENKLSYKGLYNTLLKSNYSKFSAEKSNWTAEQLDASIIADYYLEKAEIIKLIKATISETNLNREASLKNLFNRLHKIENEFSKKTYPINFSWHRIYFNKVNSF